MPDMEKLVTLNRLETLVGAYGAAPERWPEEERAAAIALIETSAPARILFDEALALDSLLDKLPEPEVSAALSSRIRSMALPAADRRSGGIMAWITAYLQPRTPRAWQGAVAMAGILGLVAGIGISSLAFHRAGPAPRAVATGTPVTIELVSIEPQLSAGDTVSLSPDLSAFSLTGEDLAEISGDEFDETLGEHDGDDQSSGEAFTVASVPLY